MMRLYPVRIAVLGVLAMAMLAQQPAQRAGTESGYGAIEQRCMTCHGSGNTPSKPGAQTMAAIRELTPEKVYQVLTSGPGGTHQGLTLTDDQKKRVAETTAGRLLDTLESGDAKNMPNRCSANSAAVTAIPGAVIFGARTGMLYALNSTDGKTMWEFDMARDFETVNKVKAKALWRLQARWLPAECCSFLPATASAARTRTETCCWRSGQSSFARGADWMAECRSSADFQAALRFSTIFLPETAEFAARQSLGGRADRQ